MTRSSVEVDADEAERCAAWLTTHMTAAGAAVLPDVPVVVEAQHRCGLEWHAVGADPGRRGRTRSRDE